MIPRKADEIALDEILQNSLSNKQSTNYSKILKAVFDQTNSKAEDYSFDATNLKVCYYSMKRVFSLINIIFK